MFKTTAAQGDLNGFLDAGSHIEGELRFEDTFRVDGKVSGTVVSKGDLIVGERGEVEGEVKVRRVFVSGLVRGTVRAADRLEITSGGRVMADLFTPSLSIEDGAFFEGRCTMERGTLERGTVERSAEAAERSNVTKIALAKER